MDMVPHTLRSSYFFGGRLFTPDDDRVPEDLKERDINLHGDPDAPPDAETEETAKTPLPMEDDGFPRGFPSTGRLHNAGIADYDELHAFMRSDGDLESLDDIGPATARDVRHAYATTRPAKPGELDDE